MPALPYRLSVLTIQAALVQLAMLSLNVDVLSCVGVCVQVVINVVQGFRPDVPEETHLPPGTSSSTCEYTNI